jgi:hypothetical protein
LAEVRGGYYNTVNTDEDIKRIDKTEKKMMAVDESD